MWGEQVSEDVRKASRVRVGKSRLLTDATTTANGGDVVVRVMARPVVMGR